MTKQDLSRWIYDTIKRHGFADVCHYELRRIFHQPERDTPLGDGIMNFCGLPDERETWERMLRANQWREVPLITDPTTSRIYPCP